LDRKGHVIADSQVIRGTPPDTFWIVSITSPAATVARHLGDHIIADDVELADETAGWRGASLIGEGAGAWVAGAQRPGLAFHGRRTRGENWEWLFREADGESATAALSGMRAADEAEVERMRIGSAIPSVPRDIGPADLPNEGGLDKEAVSYSKGCYLGQEVMARIKSMGRVRRRLVLVRGAGPARETPGGLWLGERRVGELRSAVLDAGGFLGLAMLAEGIASGGRALSPAPGAPATVEVAAGA
jgi:folate-binding protein YgfZ